MGKPKELLIELIGEEEYEKYMRGDPIRVQRSLEDNDNFYTIERKRGYADIVRTRMVTYGYGFHAYLGGLYIQGSDDSLRPAPTPPESKRASQTDSGRLRAWNIDDAVASFIVAVKNGKVNWGCGNIDVRLPSSMPPRDLGIGTFLKRGAQTILYGIVASTELIKTKITTGTMLDMAIMLVVWWVLNLVCGVGFVAVFAKEVGDKIIMPHLFNLWFNFTIIQALSLYLLVFLSKYYFSWKKGWEVKMS